MNGIPFKAAGHHLNAFRNGYEEFKYIGVPKNIGFPLSGVVYFSTITFLQY
jgi:hypothetical protein